MTDARPVQLNDAPAQPVLADDLPMDSMHHRLLPGEGDIDLLGLIRGLDEIGSQAPIGLEVFSDDLAGLPAAEVGRRLAEATRRVLAQARDPR